MSRVTKETLTSYVALPGGGVGGGEQRERERVRGQALVGKLGALTDHWEPTRQRRPQEQCSPRCSLPLLEPSEMKEGGVLAPQLTLSQY